MIKVNLVQGSAEWKAHRAKMFNASDSPVIMGYSKHKTRDQYIKECVTGEVQEVDNATQTRFNDGHRFEELARNEIAEKIIGEDLSPVTGVNGKFSASFDGITYDEDVCFEHKMLNADIKATYSDNLGICYRIQMEHQLYVSGADKCLFVASKWSDEDILIEEVHCWYFPDLKLRAEIIAAWEQVEKDKANYVHVEIIDAPEADAIQSLPAVTIQVSGEMTLCNLDTVTPNFDLFLAKAEAGKENIDIKNGDAIAKFSRAAAADCKLTAKSVVSQMTSINEAVTKLELYAKKFDAMGLAYEKEVDRLKEIEKVAALNKAKAEYAAHVAGLQAEIKSITLVLPPVDFQAAIKGLKTVESKNNALNTALANGKIAADAIAADLRKKLAWCKDNAAGQSALFPDLQIVIYKPYDDFILLITSRIEKQKSDEAARIEAQRVAMQSAADSKAKAEADAILAAERKKAEAEQAANVAAEVKSQMEAQAKKRAENEALAAELTKSANEAKSRGDTSTPMSIEKEIKAKTQTDMAVALNPKPYRPSREDMVTMLADGFDVSLETALEWLLVEFA